MRTFLVLTGLIGLAMAPPALAGQLDIKPGQWLMTAVIHMDGLSIPPEALARLPPHAQAQAQAMMQSMTQPRTTKSCVTAADLQRGFDLNHNPRAQCHQILANLNASSMEVSGTCQSGDGAATMHARFEAVDASTLHGSIEVSRVSDKGPKHMVVQIDGKWLAPECDGSEEGPGTVGDN